MSTYSTSTFKKQFATAVCVCCLVWETVLPEQQRPKKGKFKETVPIETNRLLGMWQLDKLVKAYATAVPRSIKKQLHADPWERTMTPNEIVDEVCEGVVASGGYDTLKRLMDTINDYCLEGDPTMYSVIRRGLQPLRDQDMIQQGIEHTSKTFKLDPEDIEQAVKDMYFGIFNALNLNRV